MSSKKSSAIYAERLAQVIIRLEAGVFLGEAGYFGHNLWPGFPYDCTIPHNNKLDVIPSLSQSRERLQRKHKK